MTDLPRRAIADIETRARQVKRFSKVLPQLRVQRALVPADSLCGVFSRPKLRHPQTIGPGMRGKAAMTDGEPFIDYYKILQVESDCDARTLEYAYRRLAKLYHPDHPESADVTRFNEVIEAYRALRNHDDRAEYDLIYAANNEKVIPDSLSDNEADMEEEAALSDAEAHHIILAMLYKQRREHAQDAGVAQFFIQETLKCSNEVFDFHVWYLKARGFIETTEQGTLAITIEGVDHVISTSRTKRAEKLRIAQSSNSH